MIYSSNPVQVCSASAGGTKMIRYNLYWLVSCVNNGLEMKGFLASFVRFSWVQLCTLCFSCNECCSIVKTYLVELD